MPSASTPVRIDEELYSAAKATGAAMSRSAAQQVTHWARIGRSLEASPRVSARRIAEVLGGTARYDDLGGDEQAIVRAAWEDGIEEGRSSLRLDEVYLADGRPYAELDETGRAVVRRPPPVDR